MDAGQVPEIVKDISTELSKLDPSELITFYEIDVSDIKTNLLLNKNVEITEDVFRFHNLNNLKGVTLYFNSVAYYSIPIQADGFEMTSAGNLPRPTLTITAVEGLEEPLSMMKKSFIELENLVGAKVTRIRTFAKYLNQSLNDDVQGVGENEQGLAELPRDVFFIERKSLEDKNNIQFELSSILDLENLTLPARPVLSSRCPFSYRGEGCLYEYKSYTGGPTDGDDQESNFGTSNFLPDFAPPVADAEDKLISDTLGSATYNPDDLGRTLTGSFKGSYVKTSTYTKGDVVFIEKDNIKYYFVCRGDILTGASTVQAYRSPPNGRYWLPDQCSKTLKGCKLRWGPNGKAKDCSPSSSNCTGKVSNNNFINFGGFPGTNTRVTT